LPPHGLRRWGGKFRELPPHYGGEVGFASPPLWGGSAMAIFPPPPWWGGSKIGETTLFIDSILSQFYDDFRAGNV